MKKYLSNGVIKTRNHWLSPYSTAFSPRNPDLPVGNNSKDYQYKLVLVKLETTRDRLQNYYYKAAGLLLAQLYYSRLQIILCLFNVTIDSSIYIGLFIRLLLNCFCLTCDQFETANAVHPVYRSVFIINVKVKIFLMQFCSV